MKRDTRLLRVLCAAGVAAALLGAAGLALAAVLLVSSLPPEQRGGAQDLLLPHWPVLLLALALWTGLALAAAQAAYRRWLAPPAQLLEQARVLLQPDAEHTLPAPAAQADATVQGLAEVLDGLVAQRRALQQGVSAQVAEATHELTQERRRLAALMHELQQGVIVCNHEGRILLYNRRARLQFQALGGMAAGSAGGAHFIGLGRSIYAAFEPAQLNHALDQIRHRLQRGADAPIARFLTATRAGQLLRVDVAPVLDTEPHPVSAASSEPDGFVLMLDNVTREAERESAQAAELHQLGEALRAGLARIAAAIQDLPDPGPGLRQGRTAASAPMQAEVEVEVHAEVHAEAHAETHARVQNQVQAEVQALSARLQTLDRHTAERLATRWPREDLLGADLVAAALGRLQALAAAGGGQRLRPGLLEVDAELWLHVDSYSLLQVLEHLARRLLAQTEADTAPLRLELRLQREDAGPEPGQTDHALLDLVWPGRAMSGETVLGWETEPLLAGPGGGGPLTARQVLQRHGASLGFERDRLRQQACFRLRLPCTQPPAAVQPMQPALTALAVLTAAEPGAEPEAYDFDLFHTRAPHGALDQRLLSELAFTVFDTETTGLAPAEGDQILQIGAVRVLRGRLLRHEAYEQLVNPQRTIPAAGIPIHGITAEMVRGQPPLEQVLPAFHAYAADTVLVAHNAAFDMRFLQLAETRCGGLRFDQPVLDTLLLSAVVHPQQTSQRLEHIAERLGVTVVGRHTALGDALVTAQIFVRLLPLLAAQDIHTLAQAHEASRQTYYARLRY